MDNKKPTYNYAKAKVENKQNSQQDFSVEFGKENTFDEINLTQNESTKNARLKDRRKTDAEFGQEEPTHNNKKSVSRNKKNNRHGNRNRQNED